MLAAIEHASLAGVVALVATGATIGAIAFTPAGGGSSSHLPSPERPVIAHDSGSTAQPAVKRIAGGVINSHHGGTTESTLLDAAATPQPGVLNIASVEGRGTEVQGQPARYEASAASVEAGAAEPDAQVLGTVEDVGEQATARAREQVAVQSATSDGPDELVYVSADGDTIDAQRVRSFLEEREAPLAEYAEEIVHSGVKHGVDPRIVVGIAVAESAGGERLPAGTHNAWGWSGDGPHGLKSWESWPAAIDDFTARFGRLYDGENVDESTARTYVPPNWRWWLETVNWVIDEI